MSQPLGSFSPCFLSTSCAHRGTEGQSGRTESVLDPGGPGLGLVRARRPRGAHGGRGQAPFLPFPCPFPRFPEVARFPSRFRPPRPPSRRACRLLARGTGPCPQRGPRAAPSGRAPAPGRHGRPLSPWPFPERHAKAPTPWPESGSSHSAARTGARRAAACGQRPGPLSLEGMTAPGLLTCAQAAGRWGRFQSGAATCWLCTGPRPSASAWPGAGAPAEAPVQRAS